MSYRDGMYAVFNGDDPDYQKMVQAGATIATFTVTNITLSGVELLSGGKSTKILVGQSMLQEGEGWALNDSGGSAMSYSSAPGNFSVERSDRGRSFRRRGSSGSDNYSPENSAPAATVTPASNTPADGEQSDVLKRLMQQRAQELK